MISHSASTGRHLSLHQQGGGGRHHKSRGGGSHRLLAMVALAVILAVFSAGAFLLRPISDPLTQASPESFVDQMERAARGANFDKNIYGGSLSVDRRGNQAVVTVGGIPPSVCVSVGWKLVRKGLLSINGVTPLRVSAAKLSELCNQDDGGDAVLVWSPKQAD